MARTAPRSKASGRPSKPRKPGARPASKQAQLRDAAKPGPRPAAHGDQSRRSGKPGARPVAKRAPPRDTAKTGPRPPAKHEEPRRPRKPGPRAAGKQARPPERKAVASPSTPPAAPPRRSKPVASDKGLWLYGRHAIEAALANPSRSCHRLLATPEALAKLGVAARRSGLEVQTVERAELDRRFGTDAAHQGLALSVAPLPRLDLRRACAPEAGRNLVLVLDQVTDPHNLGAILRSAAAFEVRAVVVPERRSAPFSGTVAKAASGALDLVPVVEVVNLARALDELAELGYWRLALDGQATQTLDEAPDADDLVLVLGAEGAGLRRLVAAHCDLAARLPIAPQMESLNVSVACGIALYALARPGRPSDVTTP